jgi:RNA polymerase sigma-70 factor (ECF subfamily)
MSREESIRLVSELYDSWYGVLVRYARRLAGSERAAEDVVQEAFMALFKTLAGGGRVDHPKAWTFVVVRRELSRQLRQHGGREVSLEDSPLLDLAWEEPSRASVVDFERMMKQLTRREEEVVLLRLESMTYREIGSRLGITSSSVNTLLARALGKLRIYLRGTGETELQGMEKEPLNARSTLQ